MQALFTNPSTGEKVSFLYQWETDIDFSFEAKNGTNVEVAFSTIGMKEAIRKDCANTSGDIWTCKIPDTILQYGTNVAAYITYISGNSVRVIDRADITVKKRKKPAGYVSTTDDTWITVEQMLERIEASTKNVETIENNVKSTETEVRKLKEEVEGKVNDFSSVFDNCVIEFELIRQHAVEDVNAAGTAQINAINTAGEQQVKAVEDAGSAQVSAVQEAAAEIIKDRDQIAENKSGISGLKGDLANLNSLVNEKTIQLELIDGAVLYETGVITDEYGSRFKRTDYINIRGVKRIENNVYGYNIVGTALYDSNKNFITGVVNGKDITELPSNAYYIIFTVGNSVYEQTVKMYFESELIDTLNNHEERINSAEKILNDVQEIKPYDDTEIRKEIADIKQGLNGGESEYSVYYTPPLTKGKGVNYETGEITQLSDAFAITDYISLDGAYKISNPFWGYASYGACFFDEFKQFVVGGGKRGPGDIQLLDVPTNAKYVVYTDYDSSQTHETKQVTFYYKNDVAKGLQTTVRREIDKEKYVHFSVDDCTFWTDLIDNENTYESPFENAFLSEVKANHDKYGSTWTLFCFNQIDDYDISNVPSKFSEYFNAESSWLKFQYHSENYDTLWDIDNVEAIQTSYNKCINALYKMTGTTDCIDSVTRLQSYKGSRNNMIAIRDCNCGIKGVLSPDIPNVYPYWDEVDGTIMNFMLNHDIYRDSSMQMVMVKSQKRIEDSTFDITVFNTIEYANFKPMLELMTHYTSSEWNATKNKLDTICKWLKENEYVYGFSKDVFKL